MTTAKDLINLLSAQGLEPESYSGRGMYGERCVGVSLDDPGSYDLPKGWTLDRLGLGYIIYWQGVPWPEELA